VDDYGKEVEEMPKTSLRRLSKPGGFDKRIRRELTTAALTDTEPRSLRAARLRAEKLNVSLDEMFLQDRERLRASSYPMADCLEPYEVEEYATGALSKERAQHIEICAGCRLLVSSLAPTQEQVSAFLDEVRATESDFAVVPSRWRGFWFDLVAASAAALVVSGLGYFAFRLFGSAAGDPTVRSAVFSQVTALVPSSAVLVLIVVSLFALTSLVWRNGRVFVRTSGGALTAGIALGVFAIVIGGKNVADSAAATRSVLKLQQVQLTGTVAASLSPDALKNSGLGLDLKNLRIEQSSLVKVAAWQPQPGRLMFESSVEGLPGTMLADMHSNGGQLYWDFGNKTQALAGC
jgi:hypothetical protein